MKPFRETSAETRRVVLENEWLRSQQAQQHAQEASQASKDATREALMWSELQHESQAVLPHLQELKSLTKEAEAEALRIRLQNEQASHRPAARPLLAASRCCNMCTGK